MRSCSLILLDAMLKKIGYTPQIRKANFEYFRVYLNPNSVILKDMQIQKLREK
jgi:hypothetical protein